MLIRHSLLITLTLTVGALSANSGDEITNPAQISALTAIEKRLDNLSNRIMACIDSGIAHAECLCNNRTQIREFNAAVEQLFLNHPELIGIDIVNFRNDETGRASMSLEGIQKQAATKPTCSG